MKTLATAVLFLLVVSCSSKQEKPTLTETISEEISEASVNEHIANWPSPSKAAYKKMFEEHGIPDGVTNDMLVWNDVAPYRRTIIYKDGIRHSAPRPHVDVMEHFTSGYARICGRKKS